MQVGCNKGFLQGWAFIRALANEVNPKGCQTDEHCVNAIMYFLRNGGRLDKMHLQLGKKARKSFTPPPQPAVAKKPIPKDLPWETAPKPSQTFGYRDLMEFLATDDGKALWRKTRYKAISKSNGKCCLCGRGAHEGVILHVDHIKPKSLHPELAFEIDNLQVLCEDCNIGKGNSDEKDWR